VPQSCMVSSDTSNVGPWQYGFNLAFMTLRYLLLEVLILQGVQTGIYVP